MNFHLILLMIFLLIGNTLQSSIQTDTKLLALKGDLASQLKLGLFFQNAKNANLQESFYWMKMAAKQGSSLACRYVGRAYLLGLGTVKNIDLANQWLTLAAKKGDEMAMYSLGNSYESTSDWISSSAWFSLASTYGLESSITRFNQVSQKINKEDLKKLTNLIKALNQSISKIKDTEDIINYRHTNSIKKIPFAKGDYYWGETFFNSPHGFGKRISPQGVTYQGQFKNGAENGYGTSFNAKGKIIFQGIWSDGKPQGSKKVKRNINNY